MSVITKIKEIEKKKIYFGCNPCGMQSAATSQNIAEGLGFSSIQPNIFGGVTIYESGMIKGQVNPTISGGFNVTDPFGNIEDSWMPNAMGGFDKF
mgnify:CR=1 FL=1